MNPKNDKDEARATSSVVRLLPTRCTICLTEDNSTEIYRAKLGPDAFTPAVFSARRSPDKIHYRIVKCNTCGLVRSDPTAAPEVINKLYAQGTLEYTEEIPNLRRTYGNILKKLDDLGVQKDSLLEIGCGNGFFLEEALAQGYLTVRGVEPAAKATAMAAPHVRPSIACDIIRPGLFDEGQFDVICMFHVLDHLLDPRTVLTECLRLLKPGGLILCINHNIDALSARLMGERSPIIDIEHAYLFTPDTASRIFTLSGFEVSGLGSVCNTYSIYYLWRFMPVFKKLKESVLTLLKDNFIGRIRLSLPLGNLYLIGRRPRKK